MTPDDEAIAMHTRSSGVPRQGEVAAKALQRAAGDGAAQGSHSPAGANLLDQGERDRRRAQAEELLDGLQAAGVVGVVLPWVDTSGVTRVKTVPLARLPSTAAWGVGMSPVFDAFLFDDSIVTGRFAGSAVGDLRLHPDLDRLTVLAAQPGWAWAPVDRYDQEGHPHVQDSRSLVRRLAADLAEAGFGVQAAFEVEWVLARPPSGDAASVAAVQPALTGPAYGLTRLIDVSDYARDLLAALAAEGVAVEQFHPEYATGQLEISVMADDPLRAADTQLLVRTTIRAVSARHGLRVSFSPKVEADGVGNGGHVHLSLWRDGVNLMSGGPETYGLTKDGRAFAGGIFARLAALLAIGAPSVASYLRLIPAHWAGAFAVWGRENREAAMRFVTGPIGNRGAAANFEVKCFDGAANPYLLMAGLMAAGVAGLHEDAGLPEPVEADPGTLSDAQRAAQRIVRLPESLADAVSALERDTALGAAFGEALIATIADVRRGEIAALEGRLPEEVTAALRWVH